MIVFVCLWCFLCIVYWCECWDMFDYDFIDFDWIMYEIDVNVLFVVMFYGLEGDLCSYYVWLLMDVLCVCCW